MNSISSENRTRPEHPAEKLEGGDSEVSVQTDQKPAENKPVPPRFSGAWVRCALTAELLEDAHPGSGSGGVGVDALVARDREGRPVIWASHVEGLLRDAARRLYDQKTAEVSFGRAGGERQPFIVSSLYTDKELDCRVWRSAARESFTNRAPKEDTLCAIEFVPQGTRFEGSVELPADAIPFLRRLVAEVDAIGSGRATGAGRVKLALSEITVEPRKVGTATTRLLLLLKNIDPISITKTATPTNIIPSFGFLPGRSLLGSIADWLFGQGSQTAATLLVSGRVSVSDALPLPVDETKLESKDLEAVEVIPAPLLLRTEKPPGTPGDTPWWAMADSPPRRIDAENEKHLRWKFERPDPDLFLCRSNSHSSWAAYRPSLRFRLRNGRPDPTQRDPSLFAIKQIAERTLFLAEVRAEAKDMEALAEAIRPVLEGRRWLRVGRSGAPVEVVAAKWANPPNSPGPSTSPYLILTSDLLVRDERLRWLTLLLNASTMSTIPGWPKEAEVKPILKAQESVAVQGFNGTSRLWRQPAAAIRRGSVFKVEGTGIAELARAAAEGRWLGERTHEGFGRFRLDTVLPGITDGAIPNTEDEKIHFSSAPDEPDDVIAEKTRQWLNDHPRLADPSARCPSLSQWFDLVSDLDKKLPIALSSRRDPVTAGKRAWLNADAQGVREEIEKVSSDERAAHARMFLRWLRVEMWKKTRQRES